MRRPTLGDAGQSPEGSPGSPSPTPWTPPTGRATPSPAGV